MHFQNLQPLLRLAGDWHTVQALQLLQYYLECFFHIILEMGLFKF